MSHHNGQTLAYAVILGVAAILSLSAPEIRAQTLPAESVLPGAARAGAGPDRRPYPSEATLPASQRTGGGGTALPPESILPQSTQPVQDQKTPFLAEVNSANPPRLRLNLQGHVDDVRCLSFAGTDQSLRLCSGGFDKNVEVWAHRPGIGNTDWQHERTIRWQVARGDSGRVLVMAGGDQMLAFGGIGAMGEKGEVLVVRPRTGGYVAGLGFNERSPHRTTLLGLGLSADKQMATADADGRVVYWWRDLQRGGWKNREVEPPLASLIRDQPDSVKVALNQWIRTFFPVAIGGGRVFSPRFVRVSEDRFVWKLQQKSFDPNGMSRAKTTAGTTCGGITAIACSSSGSLVAVADDTGHVSLYEGATLRRLHAGFVNRLALTLSFSDDGSRLLIGTDVNQNQPAHLVLWDVSAPSRPQEVWRRRTLARPVESCALSHGGKWYAYNQGGEIAIGKTALGESGQAEEKFSSPVEPLVRVAFSNQRPFHKRIAVATGEGREFDAVFDTETLQLNRDRQSIEPADQWIDPHAARGDWKITSNASATKLVHESDSTSIPLPLNYDLHGVVSAACWMPDEARNGPAAVAVGMQRGGVFIFDMQGRILRQFRGHFGAVVSLGVSADQRYLVSAASDSAIRIWKLEGYRTVSASENRWGARFEVRDGKLVAQKVRDDGPLFFRGLREGDVVTQIKHWASDTQKDPDISSTPEPMRMALESRVRWDGLAVLHYERDGIAKEPFQSFPAWQPMASLFIAPNREWAYWTPAGVYDASFNGHRLFGWQINPNHLRQLPEFLLASQLRKQLEKPDVMRQLLKAGSLQEAFKVAKLRTPAEPHKMIASQYMLKPKIEIVSPQVGAAWDRRRLTVRAEVRALQGVRIVEAKAFANGVAATNRRLIDIVDEANGVRNWVYEWDALLPHDPEILIQVASASEAEAVAEESLAIRTNFAQQAGKRGRLYVLTAAVDDYGGDIPKLKTPHNNARQFADVLKQGARPFYLLERSISLKDANVSSNLWRAVTRDYADQIRDQVRPDDLVVVFLSGHGIQDPRTGDYYFVGANARKADLDAGRYSECLSFADLNRFASLPCRKLVVLDTCHSGAAIEPLRQSQMKQTLRSLQEDLVFTITASDGQQQAFELQEENLSRFSYWLIKGLQGEADQNGDRQVTIREAAEYVRTTVQRDAAQESVSQVPVLSPTQLLPYANVPLVVSGS